MSSLYLSDRRLRGPDAACYRAADGVTQARIIILDEIVDSGTDCSARSCGWQDALVT